MVFGTPGADTQPQAQLQFFLNVVEFGMTVQQALEQPSIVSTGFKSSYYPHDGRWHAADSVARPASPCSTSSRRWGTSSTSATCAASAR